MATETLFTFDYFRDEFKRFWDMCGDARQTSERLRLAFNGLVFVAANTREKTERVSHMLTVAAVNYERRLPYFIMKEVHSNGY